MVTPYYSDELVTLYHGGALETLQTMPDNSINCCITSPPYFGLRDYGVDGQIGLQATPALYVAELTAVFSEVRRVLAEDGTLWLNLGDSYSNNPSWGRGESSQLQGRKHAEAQIVAGRHDVDFELPSKNLIGIPWRVALSLQEAGWILRQDIIWAKTNPMPESVTDRCTKSHEYLFLLTKSPRYHFDADAIAEPSLGIRATDIRFGGSNYGDSDSPKHATASGNTYTDSGTRNRRSVWTISTQPFLGGHFATMPIALADRCVQAGCKPGGVVLDPFSGSGTAGLAAARHGRKYVGIDSNAEYLELSMRTRLSQSSLNFLSKEGGTW